ncbi:ABC transporter ATP-binding protein [Limnohabitans sp. B9-3]|uniref:ABC transporter ATP-binding protein n=1 Tax=Limnohabitans sp. B9-3 TaxID=1100707 RepID=UPI000C1F8205|nr:ABC transporter ATP-binding protein [Limnohabitans sp. B9-3]PIT75484.1 ABC transporter ATP-binding protein [Limnohabitans sp. B9-3]
MTELLHIENLTAGYGAIQVLQSINLSLTSGGRLALIGRNGVGKTTLLKAVMGLADMKGGQIKLDGLDISKWSVRERANAGIGYVPQTRDIFPSLTVEENLLAGLKGRPRSALEEAYALFPRLAERRNNGGQQLSGGEQQMLSVARTLLGQPRLLLLDEPLEGLAPIICIELMRAFELLAQETGVAVLLVEQKVENALRFAPRAMVLERGEVVHESDSAALTLRKDLLERFVGVAGAH